MPSSSTMMVVLMMMMTTTTMMTMMMLMLCISFLLVVDNSENIKIAWPNRLPAELAARQFISFLGFPTKPKTDSICLSLSDSSSPTKYNQTVCVYIFT